MKLRQLAVKRKALEAQIAVLQAEGEADAAEVRFAMQDEARLSELEKTETEATAALRGGINGGKRKGNRRP